MISIIIPVYNSGKYLSRCIESVLSQTSCNWELILIDDGSSDNSGDICDYYAAHDNRISVVHQENKGVSSARNVGLIKAKGEWITFCDSDDELYNRAVENYISSIKEDIDIIRGGFTRVMYNDELNITTANTVTDDKEAILSLCNDSRYEAYLWNSCFRKTTIGSIRFNETISWCEDHLFTFQIIGKARKVQFISELVYKYYVPVKEKDSFGSNLSTRYLEPYMILKEANLERQIKKSFILNKTSSLHRLIESEYHYKINLALKYAVTKNRYFTAIKIAVSNGLHSICMLGSIIFHAKITSGIRKILNINIF